jgi:hypothetical protein
MGTALCDDSCIWSAIDSAQIADTTKSNHKRRLHFLMQHVYNRRTKIPLLHLVSHPAYAVKAIEAQTDEPQTRKTYVSSILAFFPTKKKNNSFAMHPSHSLYRCICK